jgi:hypothetical protein
MQVARQRDPFRDSSGYFRKMFDKCEARAVAATNPDDQSYWLGLAQIWRKLAGEAND